MSDEKQRAMMAAHLLHAEARYIMSMGDRFRVGIVAGHVGRILEGGRPFEDYHAALAWQSVPAAQIDAAIYDIQRGEYPADSLVGKVRAMHATSLEDIGVAQTETRRMACAGQAHAFGAVLALLGVTP